MQAAGVEIDVLPGQPDGLAAAQAERGAQQHGALHVLDGVERVDELLDLSVVEGLLLLGVDLRAVGLLAGVLGDDAVLLGVLHHERHLLADVVHVGA